MRHFRHSKAVSNDRYTRHVLLHAILRDSSLTRNGYCVQKKSSRFDKYCMYIQFHSETVLFDLFQLRSIVKAVNAKLVN